jgi:hypothetical protein
MGELRSPKGMIFRRNLAVTAKWFFKKDMPSTARAWISSDLYKSLYKKEVVTVYCYHSSLLLIGIVIALAGDVLFDVHMATPQLC